MFDFFPPIPEEVIWELSLLDEDSRNFEDEDEANDDTGD